MIPAALLPYKWAMVAAAFAATAAVSGAAAWTAQGWRKDAVIADLKATRANEVATDATKALDQFTDRAKAIADAASGAQASNAATAATLLAIRKELKNAKPLPADCRPDADRLRNRNAAIKAYNDAATGRLPGGAVQDH